MTTTTQGMVEADRWKSVLRLLDEYICEGLADFSIYGYSEKTKPRWLELCLKKLREAYPVEDQNRDLGVPPTAPKAG